MKPRAAKHAEMRTSQQSLHLEQMHFGKDSARGEEVLHPAFYGPKALKGRRQSIMLNSMALDAVPGMELRQLAHILLPEDGGQLASVERRDGTACIKILQV